MALATGVSLANPTAIIDALATEVALRGWTVTDDPNSPSTTTREMYFTKAAANTKNGEIMTFGIWAEDADTLQLSCSFDTFSDWTGGGLLDDDYISNGFNSTQNTNKSRCMQITDTAFWQCEVSQLNTGGNYIRHWIFSPVDTGAAPADHQYIYMVIEIETGVYRSLFFGEVEKYDVDAWQGGVFCEGNTYNPVNQNSVEPFSGGYVYNTVNQATRGGGYMHVNVSNVPGIYQVDPGNNFAVWGQVRQSGSLINPRMVGTGGRQLGRDYLERSPAQFSGQAMRWPAESFVEEEGPGGTEPLNLIPLGEIPDFFHTTIADFTPGTVITDDTEKFLVVPVTSKGGTLDTGSKGFLIRNPNL